MLRTNALGGKATQLSCAVGYQILNQGRVQTRKTVSEQGLQCGMAMAKTEDAKKQGGQLQITDLGVQIHSARPYSGSFLRNTPSLLSPSQGHDPIQVSYVSPYKMNCPYDTIILYNPSAHANNIAVEELMAVWGQQQPKLTIIQVVQEDRAVNLGVGQNVIRIDKGKWGDMEHFEQRLKRFVQDNPSFKGQKIGFFPIWQALSEEGRVARFIDQREIAQETVAQKATRLHWIGEPAEGLEKFAVKVPFKEACERLGIPTSPFFKLDDELSEEHYGPLSDDVLQSEVIEALAELAMKRYASKMKPGTSVFLKSGEFGGGGKGTIKVGVPTKESFSDALHKMLAETKHLDTVYVEEAMDLTGKYMIQHEQEVDGGGNPVNAHRFVNQNPNGQKFAEIGVSAKVCETYFPGFVNNIKSEVARLTQGYKTRGTDEALLVVDPKKGPQDRLESYVHCELNGRVQVEHEANSELEMDRYSNTVKTIPELVTRSAGYPAPGPQDRVATPGVEVAGHFRILIKSPDKNWSQNQGAVVTGFHVPDIEGVKVSVNKGPLQPDADSQIGRVTITAKSLEEMSDKLYRFFDEFTLEGDNVECSYSDFMKRYALLVKEKGLILNCKCTEDVLATPLPKESPLAQVRKQLNAVTEALCDPEAKPSGRQIERAMPTSQEITLVQAHRKAMRSQLLPETPFSKNMTKRVVTFEDRERYYDAKIAALEKHGGGMSTVDPRDTRQEAGRGLGSVTLRDNRQALEVYGVKAGMHSIDLGGAMEQTGEIEGLSATQTYIDGLPYNAQGQPLTRSGWWRDLNKKTPEQLAFVAGVQARLAKHRYGMDPKSPVTPVALSNFHAGNHPNKHIVSFIGNALGYSILDNHMWFQQQRGGEKAIRDAVNRNIDMHQEFGLIPREERIKNAGEGKEWTAETIWNEEIEPRLAVYKERGLPVPIIQVHNHNFTGSASREASNLLRLAQKNGYRRLIIDTAPPRTTHNNNMEVFDALENTTFEMRQALLKYNEVAHAEWALLNQYSTVDIASRLMPPDTESAGGTLNTDIASAKALGIAVGDIEPAKKMAFEYFKLYGHVTPYSEHQKVIGYKFWRAGIKTGDDMHRWVNDHKLMKKEPDIQIDAGILKDLANWESEVPMLDHVKDFLKVFGYEADPTPWELQLDRPNVIKCLNKYFPELEIQRPVTVSQEAYGAAEGEIYVNEVITENGEDKIVEFTINELLDYLKNRFSHIHGFGYEQVAEYLQFKDKAVALWTKQVQGRDRTGLPPELILAPDVMAKNLPFTFEVKGIQVTCLSQVAKGNGIYEVLYRIGDSEFVRKQGINPAEAAASKGVGHSVQKATPGNKLEVGNRVDRAGAELTKLYVKPGDVIQAGQLLYQEQISKEYLVHKASPKLDGLVVESICVKPRSEDNPGEIMQDNQLILKLKDPSSFQLNIDGLSVDALKAHHALVEKALEGIQEPKSKKK